MLGANYPPRGGAMNGRVGGIFTSTIYSTDSRNDFKGTKTTQKHHGPQIMLKCHPKVSFSCILQFFFTYLLIFFFFFFFFSFMIYIGVVFSGRRTPPPVCLPANGSLTVVLRRAIALALQSPSHICLTEVCIIAPISYPYLTSEPKVMYRKKMRGKILRTKI